MNPTTLIADVIAVRRLTRLIQDDRITEELRDLYWDKFPVNTKMGFLLTCPWCVSIWAGLAIFGLRKLSPETANILSGLLAASEITGQLDRRGL